MVTTSDRQAVTGETGIFSNHGPGPSADHKPSVDWQQIGPRLTEPFCTPKWRVQRTSKERVQGKYPEGTRGLVVAYIDARQVFSRLDELFGPDGWQTGYRVLDAASGAIECTLTIAGNQQVRRGLSQSQWGRGAAESGVLRCHQAGGGPVGHRTLAV